MKWEVIKNSKTIKVIKYKNAISKRDFYIMYLYNKELYDKYKGFLWDNRFIITKVYDLKGCIKFCYKKGYDPTRRIEYYSYWSKIGIKQCIERGLIK